MNQDDISAYHLFYADGLASPGSDIHFFDWPVGREMRGTGGVVRTGLRAPGRDALARWQNRLVAAGVTASGVMERDGRLVVDFEDPEGQRLMRIPEPSRITRGFKDRFRATIRSSDPERSRSKRLDLTDEVLRQILGMAPVRRYAIDAGKAHVYGMGSGGERGKELHVVIEPSRGLARPGAGGVHHLALRTADTGYQDWVDRLAESGVPSSGPVDRYSFRSLYFRDPSGVLFEIATDGPGFATDEPLETLGQALSLPPFLEERRASIEAGLKPSERHPTPPYCGQPPGFRRRRWPVRLLRFRPPTPRDRLRSPRPTPSQARRRSGHGRSRLRPGAGWP